jgi:small-conductance mechanosensitive channel
MNLGRRAAWQALWFYALFVVVLVMAFNLFHISLTQFSVVSGALAVGIGFGSQNLISNFISGIILLIERPVNQGDVIEIDGRRVTVERLGARSTIVRTLDNTHMVVPNSRLLDQPVINWTLSDEVVRQQIQVGVAYGSPTRRVAELLHGVLAAVEQVRKEPPPLVKFAAFGESSLDFEIFFWATIAERLATENELRHRIAEVFDKEKIVMAFPQRDIHLETSKPLQVVIMPPTDRDEVRPNPAADGSLPPARTTPGAP